MSRNDHFVALPALQSFCWAICAYAQAIELQLRLSVQQAGSLIKFPASHTRPSLFSQLLVRLANFLTLPLHRQDRKSVV